MFHLHQRKEGLSAAILGLWRNWAVAIGVLVILPLVSIHVRQIWMPAVCLIAFFSLLILRGAMTRKRIPVCSRLYKEVSIIILILAIAVIIRNLVAIRMFPYEVNGQPFNESGPLVGILISAPITAIVSLFFLFQRNEPSVCLLCRQRYGNVIRNGFVGVLYEREWRYQTRLLFILSIIISATDWGYYLTRYINISLNQSDYFFFMWFPLMVYVMSLIHLGWRYYSLWVFYCQRDESHIVEHPSSTTVRFVVIAGDKILLTMRPTDKAYNNGKTVNKFDTPASVVLPYHDRFPLEYAIALFSKTTGINNAELRPIYASPDNVTYHNIVHFFAFLDSPDDITNSKLQGEWFSLSELRHLISQHLTGIELTAEFARIYSVAMAWKTYDRKGNRLYPFKHYRPTFRLKDIRGWDVDYSDSTWLAVWRLNEDSQLFRLRRILFTIEEKLTAAFI
jgi:hypothetical protein